jgi:hypothetical protein
MHEAQKLQDEQEHEMWLARQEYQKQLIEAQQQAQQAAPEGPTQ